MVSRFNRKYLLISIIVWVIVLTLLFVVIKYFPTWYNRFFNTVPGDDVKPYVEPPKIEQPTIITPTEGNEFTYTTNNLSTVRVINEYDINMFLGKKTILIMWASWCHNCAQEFEELEKIVNYYKDSDINIVLISHNNDIDSLVQFIEEGTYTYDTEVLFDLHRVIRKAIDPEASTIPMSYVLGTDTSIKYKHNSIVSLELINQWVETYY